tara:strand:- start:3323 stop:4420 length:1098 start_codon:yes stop_codon:yes gene_type:complete
MTIQKKNIKSHTNAIIATIGPSCNTVSKLLELKKAGANIFRVNMSHSTIEELRKYAQIGIENNLRIGLDTEGSQIRTNLKDCTYLDIKKDDNLKIYNNISSRDEFKGIALYPENTVNNLDKGCIIRLDFNGAIVIVEKKNTDYIDCKCISPGRVGNNKGVDVLNKKIYLPDFTSKDIESFKEIRNLGIQDVFISFCKSKDAVLKLKNISNKIKVTSKIECKESIHNLHSICEVSDAILIDRGDLTREINIMDIPFAQRGIIKVSNFYEKPCYVATNIFESLIEGDLPTRAELNDVVGTLEMGAEGLVLAAETAIGKKPILSVEIIKELIHRYQLYRDQLLFADTERDEITDENMKIWLNRNNKKI